MTNAIRDSNYKVVGLALSYIDGTTLVPVVINASNGGMLLDLTHTKQFTNTQIAKRDDNKIPILMGVDETGALHPLLADPATGAVLADVA